MNPRRPSIGFYLLFTTLLLPAVVNAKSTALELTAYKYALEGEGTNELFIPFTDKTTGKDTYGGGRYLIVDEPPEGDEIQIDFKLVINPLCTYAAVRKPGGG